MIIINNKKKNKLFSIITVTKNSSKTLDRCLKSLKKQKCKDFEHLIIDGKSTDKTIKIIKENSKHISFALSETDQNMWDAINKGIKHSKGKIIGILNSDDILYPNGLKIIKDYFYKKKIDFLFGSVKKKKIYSGFSPQKINYKFNIFPSHSVGFFITKKASSALGKYDTSLKYCADYDYIFRLLKKGYKGSHTCKSEVIGKFYPGGMSEKLNFFEIMYYQAKVRIKHQNIAYVFLLIILHVIYYYFVKFIKIFNFKIKLF